MIYQINQEKKSINPVISKWIPKEVELEEFLLPKDQGDPVLESSVFRESLLLINNQVRTKYKKRADILALDKAGNGVIIELKRDVGILGVENQALQYLSDFSAFHGEFFLTRFSREPQNIVDHVAGFLGDDVRIENINKRSRIILIARGFDPAVFSMGEWLSEHGVAFKCIEYLPFELEGKHYLSFSVAFDRSTESLYPLIFQSRFREPGYFWHNIGSEVNEWGHSDVNDWWHFLVQNGQISAGFENRPADQGERILKNYIQNDVVIAYCSGFGAIGYGIIENPNSYKLIQPGSPDDFRKGKHLHRLDIIWKACASNIEDGLSIDVIRSEFGIHHPVSTSVRINGEKAKILIDRLNNKFHPGISVK